MPATTDGIRKKSTYEVHPGFAMEKSSMLNLQKQTGKSLEDWIEIVNDSGLETEKERAEWLKWKHKLGTNIAGWIAERAAGKRGAEDYDPDAMVEAMFADKKSLLLPIYEALLKLGLELGDDMKACPCKTFVPLYRKHVIAQIKPSTNTRIDFGLALKNTKAKGRLVDTGGYAKGDRITHRIAVTSLVDIDDELKSWLKKAYELDGKVPG
jgi:hypothetical protein